MYIRPTPFESPRPEKGMNSRNHDFPLLVDQRLRLVGGLRATLDRQTERLPGIVNPQCDVFDAIAVLVDVGRDVAVRPQRGRQHQPHLALSQNVAGAIARSRLRAAVGDDLIAKDIPIELRRLLGVTDVKLYEIRSVDRKGIGDLLRCPKCRCSHDFSAGPLILKLANRTPERGDSTPRGKWQLEGITGPHGFPPCKELSAFLSHAFQVFFRQRQWSRQRMLDAKARESVIEICGQPDLATLTLLVEKPDDHLREICDCRNFPARPWSPEV